MTARTQVPGFAFLSALSILFWWHSLVTTWGLALANDAYTHILLILPLSGALIYMNAKYIDEKALRTSPVPRPRLGSALLALALVIGCCTRWGMGAAPDDVRLTLAMLALVIWWIASVLLCFGARTFQSFLFPLCFLFLLVPIPDFALSWIIEFLQHQSASAAQIMFRAAGVPATQDGIMLSIPGLDIEVARECSSIRSSLMLVVTTIVLAHLFLRSWWRKLLLIAATIPLSVAKNGLRIFTIVELGTRMDPGFLNGKLHHNGGIIFFGIAVVAMMALLWVLRRTEFLA
ncbi:MAG TPA: exosortase/archaeosortase family protein [Terriglobales bacterium]|nr:exosortase/archaeosortase family protein [Terriglobales bacterium]